MKKVTILFVLFTVFFFNIANSKPVNVCPGDVALSSQAEVNAFTSTEVTGRLTISGNDITNLGSLSILEKAGSIVITDNDQLQNLNGLESITSIEELIISDNPELLTITAFANLESIGVFGLSIVNNPKLINLGAFNALTNSFSVSIEGNSSLTSVDGFTSLVGIDVITGVIRIANNASLQTIEGFSSFTTAFNASLNISDNDALISFNGFNGVTTLGGLLIMNNSSLTNLDGLSSLETLQGRRAYLSVSNNTSLVDVNGLSSLTSINGSSFDVRLLINDNPALKNLDGLSSLTLLDGNAGERIEINNNALLENTDGLSALRFENTDFTHSFISVANNPSLTRCCGLFPLLNDIGEEGISEATITIANNGAGCTLEDILAGGLCPDYSAVVSFDVVDISGKVLMPLTEGAKINIKDPLFKAFSIRANTNPEIVGSVKFWLNGQFFRVENVAPYAFNGDVNGVYNPWAANPWDYTILAIPYVKVSGKEYAGQPLEVHFKVVSETIPLTVSDFDVVDTSGKFLKHLNEGDEINVGDPLYKAMTVVANTTGQVGSVKFLLNNQFYRTENVAPYTITGDQNGYFNPWFPQVGNYTLSGTPYSQASAGGTSGIPLTIHFTVVNKTKSAVSREETPSSDDEILKVENETLGVSLYPVPVGNELNVKMEERADYEATLVILNAQGTNFYSGTYSESSINTLDLKAGVYFLKIVGRDGFQKVVKFIKK